MGHYICTGMGLTFYLSMNIKKKNDNIYDNYTHNGIFLEYNLFRCVLNSGFDMRNELEIVRL